MKRKIIMSTVAAVAATIAGVGVAAGANSTTPQERRNQQIESKINSLLKRMTTTEKLQFSKYCNSPKCRKHRLHKETK